MVNNTVVVYIRIGSSRDAIARAASYFHSASTPEDIHNPSSTGARNCPGRKNCVRENHGQRSATSMLHAVQLKISSLINSMVCLPPNLIPIGTLYTKLSYKPINTLTNTYAQVNNNEPNLF